MKKLLSALIAVVLCLSVGTQSVYALIQDVPVSHKYFDSITKLEERGVVGNTEKFRPNEEITHQELIALLLKNANIRPTQGTNFSYPYKDVPRNSDYAPYIDAAYKMGFIPNTEFLYPTKTLSRFEALKLVFYVEGVPVPRFSNANIKYRDVKKGSYFARYIEKAQNLKVMSPENSSFFGIYKKISRGQTADLLQRMFVIRNGGEITAPKTEDSNSNSSRNVKTSNDLSDYEELETFHEAFSIIMKNFYDAPNLSDEEKEELINEAIKAMVGQLGDQYSQFLSPDEANNLRVSLDNEVEGIGAYVNVEDNGDVVIISPVKGSAADKAGLKAGDLILEIDGVSTEGLNVTQVVSKIKGEVGTIVKMRILRPETRTNLDFSIRREKVKIASVILEFDEQNIAHLLITQFGTDTSSEFRKAVTEIIERQPQGIVLDLRNNPGGYLNASVRMLGEFLDPGTIAVKIEYSDDTEIMVTTGEPRLKDFKTVMLANKGSASASEIMIGALLDESNIPLLGTKTFGKGTVQELNFFTNDAILKLTVAKWITPNGNWINKTGFTPSIEVEDDTKTLDVDEALERAKQEILK